MDKANFRKFNDFKSNELFTLNSLKKMQGEEGSFF